MYRSGLAGLGSPYLLYNRLPTLPPKYLSPPSLPCFLPYELVFPSLLLDILPSRPLVRSLLVSFPLSLPIHEKLASFLLFPLAVKRAIFNLSSLAEKG